MAVCIKTDNLDSVVVVWTLVEIGLGCAGLGLGLRAFKVRFVVPSFEILKLFWITGVLFISHREKCVNKTVEVIISTSKAFKDFWFKCGKSERFAVMAPCCALLKICFYDHLRR